MFALGAILTCVLTGRPPIEGATAINRIVATLNGKIALPRDRRRDVPRELNSIAAKALALSQGARYPIAEAFVSDLKAYLAGENVAAHRYGIRERVQLFPRRHPRDRGQGRVRRLASGPCPPVSGLQGSRDRPAASPSSRRHRRRLARPEPGLQLLGQAAVAEGRLVHAPSDGVGDRRVAEEISGRHGDWVRFLVGAGILADSCALERTEEQKGNWRLELAAVTAIREAYYELGSRESRDKERIKFARKVHELTLTSSKAREAWNEARAAVANDPRYGGLELEPAEGLLPLGRDPESGLWEFWHPESGERPLRGPDGRHHVVEASSLVMVLVPSGTYQMGSERGNPNERPVHEVRWRPLPVQVRADPGPVGEDDPREPESFRAQAQCRRSGGHIGPPRRAGELEPRARGRQSGWECDFPAKPEWEYACRAGTTSPWWSGEEAASLRGAANVADKASQVSAWATRHTSPTVPAARRTPRAQFPGVTTTSSTRRWGACAPMGSACTTWPATCGSGWRTQARRPTPTARPSSGTRRCSEVVAGAATTPSSAARPTAAGASQSSEPVTWGFDPPDHARALPRGGPGRTKPDVLAPRVRAQARCGWQSGSMRRGYPSTRRG